jgi:hypothetical protein
MERCSRGSYNTSKLMVTMGDNLEGAWRFGLVLKDRHQGADCQSLPDRHGASITLYMLGLTEIQNQSAKIQRFA